MGRYDIYSGDWKISRKTKRVVGNSCTHLLDSYCRANSSPIGNEVTSTNLTHSGEVVCVEKAKSELNRHPNRKFSPNRTRIYRSYLTTSRRLHPGCRCEDVYHRRAGDRLRHRRRRCLWGYLLVYDIVLNKNRTNFLVRFTT